MKKKKYMGKIIGLLFFSIYVFVAIDLLALYNYDSEKIIINYAGYDYNSANNCPLKPENLHLQKFFYNMQNQRIVANILNNDSGYSVRFISSKNNNDLNINYR